MAILWKIREAKQIEVEGKYKITKTVTVVMKKYYMILVLFNDMILYDAAVIIILHEIHHTKIT